MGRRRNKLSDQPFEVDITGLDSRGLGLAVHAEKTLKVTDALAGEKVIARYLFGRKQRGRVEVLEIKQASPDRVQPRCPHFGNCGGCSLQHMSMEAQLASKQASLLKSLRDAGGSEPATLYAPLRGPEWNYRRKARLSVRDVAGKGRVLVGFRERDGRYVADMQSCHVLSSKIANALPQMSLLLEKLSCRGQVPQLEVACDDQQCALIIRHLVDITRADTEHLQVFSQVAGIGIYLQSAGPDSIHLLAPPELQLEYSLESLGLRFEFGPQDFIQVNGELNQQMVMRALVLLQPQAEDNILDLFCGLGNFTLALATRAGRVMGVEGSAEMVERARSNASLNALSNVEFAAINLYANSFELGSAAPWPGTNYNKIMLDPPRSGAQELLPWIAASSVSHVLYISCNPGTLATDAALLVKEYGFSLAGAGIINMFPHTAHNEAIALFVREQMVASS